MKTTQRDRDNVRGVLSNSEAESFIRDLLDDADEAAKLAREVFQLEAELALEKGVVATLEGVVEATRKLREQA